MDISPAFQAALINDSLRYIHLLAVAIGLGTSFLADATLFRRLKAPLSDGFLATLHWCHLLVTWALIAMWVSGAALIYLRTGFVWDNFSPKLLAKVVVVTVLSVNAFMIGAIAMPSLKNSIGVCPTELSLKTKLPLAIVAGVSTTSWLLALLLGSSVILKTAEAGVFVVLLSASYAACILIAAITAGVLHRTLGRPQTMDAPAE